MRVPLRPASLLVFALCAVLAHGSLAGAAQPGPPVDVTTCGQVVSGAGRLAFDLDCTGVVPVPRAAVMVMNHGSLDLNGHTLRGGPASSAVGCVSRCKDGVTPATFCPGDCTVFGGTITAPSSGGVGGRNLTLHDVTITVNTVGVYALRRLTIMDSTIGGSDYVEASGRWIKIYRSTLTGAGLEGISTVLRNSSLKLFDTTVSGHLCDLSTWRLPRLHGSTCATSCGGGRDGLGTWGVCTDD